MFDDISHSYIRVVCSAILNEVYIFFIIYVIKFRLYCVPIRTRSRACEKGRKKRIVSLYIRIIYNMTSPGGTLQHSSVFLRK